MKQPREQIVDFLRAELVGPDPTKRFAQENGEEILVGDPPRIRYGAGVLFPQAVIADVAEDTSPAETSAQAEPDEPRSSPQISLSEADSGNADDSDEADYSVALANAFLPSALGFSCFADIPAAGFVVTVNAGRYRKADTEYEVKGEKKKGYQYERSNIFTNLSIPAGSLLGDGTCTLKKDVLLEAEKTGLGLVVISRRSPLASTHPKARLLTFTIVNNNKAAGGRAENAECFFQVSLSIKGADGDSCFVEYPENDGEPLDEDDESMRLLYRGRKTFAIGHGCAVDWDTKGERAIAIRSEILPTYEVKPIVPATFPDLRLSMFDLSDLGSENAAVRTLTSLCNKYETWIRDRRALAKELGSGLKQTADRHLNRCDLCLDRMRAGLEILQKNPKAMLSFRLANRAMLLQQLHYASPLREWKQVGKSLVIDPFRSPDLSKPPSGKGYWYPFQLAFLLMNVRPQVEPEHADRDIVDLIWFPTGGGKTEAYLALTAFTIFYRRMMHPQNAGVTVLMRYTLRLLTAQQFQRAATLICACDAIRAERTKELGEQRISIGLWVGQGLTPNRRTEAIQSLRRLVRAEENRNPFLLLRCPWCSAQMGPIQGKARRVLGYEEGGAPKTVVFRCPDGACNFGGSGTLPALVIDEDIYANPPTLLIGTVDKFALLPWRADARLLFISEGASRPPDLIVQDELHLIAGPLGSMAGHFETVIDELCCHNASGKRWHAKIIASTATIRGAREQTHSLYNRELFQFPPPGLDMADSFFAIEDTKSLGRLYVGVHASALPSHVTAQVRVFATLLQAAKSVAVKNESERDPHFTLLAYFNSLRELGHATTLVRSDITEYLSAIALRKRITGDERRFITNALELTSRVPSAEIPEALQHLERSYPNETDRPVDICLATNMISVGIDIPRLGLMAVVGQPKTTSEYIQATSRVGRSVTAPGLVVVIYHTGKPRDRSHYEHFRSYHAALYREVEPTSVTPFSAPVRERALQSLLVTLVRYLGGPANLANPQPFPSKDLLDRIRKIISERVSGVDDQEKKGTERLLNELIERWRRVQPPRYGDFGPPQKEIPLMYPAGSVPLVEWDGKSRATPTSMRNVDASCEANVLGQYPKPESIQ
jgi:hypothetical protein